MTDCTGTSNKTSYDWLIPVLEYHGHFYHGVLIKPAFKTFLYKARDLVCYSQYWRFLLRLAGRRPRGGKQKHVVHATEDRRAVDSNEALLKDNFCISCYSCQCSSVGSWTTQSHADVANEVGMCQAGPSAWSRAALVDGYPVRFGERSAHMCATTRYLGQNLVTGCENTMVAGSPTLLFSDSVNRASQVRKRKLGWKMKGSALDVMFSMIDPI